MKIELSLYGLDVFDYILDIRLCENNLTSVDLFHYRLTYVACDRIFLFENQAISPLNYAVSIPRLI